MMILRRILVAAGVMHLQLLGTTASVCFEVMLMSRPAGLKCQV